MEIKRENISCDPATGKFTVRVAMYLVDGNPLLLKAKAELYGNVLDKMVELIDAQIAEFAEKYGDQVIRFVHDDHLPTDPAEIQQKLLSKGWPNNKET